MASNNSNHATGSPDDSPFVSGRGYSLESILADVKSSAFIEGETGTPSHILEAEAERILREAAFLSNPDTGKSKIPQVDIPVKAETAAEFSAEPSLKLTEIPDAGPEMSIEAEFGLTSQTPDEPAPVPKPKPEPEPAPPPEPQYHLEPAHLSSIQFFEDPTPETVADRLISEAYSKYDEPEFKDTDDIPVIVTPSEDELPASSTRAQSRAASGPLFAEDLPSIDIELDIDNAGPAPRSRTSDNADTAPRSAAFDNVIIDDGQLDDDEEDEEELYEEPRLKDQAVRFARSCNSISQRLLPAFLITLIMAFITFSYEAGMAVPYGIGRSLEHTASALVVLLLIVMMLCVEVLIRGVDFLVRGQPNAETLVLFSCVFSLLSAVFTVVSGTARMMPFCAVSALSLVFAAFGERFGLRAMTDSLKTAISSAEPYGVQAEFNENLNNSVIKKSYGRTDGFYSNLTEQDITEMLYRYAAPALLILALLITVLNALVSGSVDNSLHMLSALLASAAPFSALLAYTLPFSIITKALRATGVALAGWGGADEIAHTDGVCVTDDDLFPQGTLRLSSVKVFDGAPQNNVLCYTASLIMASGSGLAGLFAQVLEEQGITPLRVIDFDCHESGISAIIQGHQVATGSAAYMNLIGVRVPDDSNLRNAVFTAVNKRLVAMFAIDYKPLPVVQGALISLLKWHIDLYFAMRDFNITPSMVGQKFKVPFESFVFMSVKDSYSISDPYSGKQGRMSSVLIRESLGPYAEAITGARLLRSASMFAAALSVASAVLGVFVMSLMLWGGSFMSATPGNLIIFMLWMLGAVLLVCGYVRVRR